MNIVFDLDGTLIDSKPRLYRLFQHLVPSSQLSYDQYWEFKRNKISNEVILSSEMGFNKDAITCFVTEWMRMIESPEYLELDSNFPDMHATLARLQGEADLYVCTARQLRQPVLDQLERLNLLPFFTQVLVTEQKNTKENLIGTHIKNLCECDWMLGDTGKDIQVGKLLSIKTCAVLSGFLDYKNLHLYNPDLIVDSVIDFYL